jgi:S-adenosylmethionine hydrolase
MIAHTTHRTLVSLSSDFGIESAGVGIMKGVILGINPNATVIDLTHGIKSYSTIDGAGELETAFWLPIGIHICVVDKGVGTSRRPIIIRTRRGDCLIGPDNGVLIPATHLFGGITGCWQIANEKYLLLPVSSTFHGRDVFSSCAGWLSTGIDVETVGPSVEPDSLAPAPFTDATFRGPDILCTVIHVNKFGSIRLNLQQTELERLGVRDGDFLYVSPQLEAQSVRVPFHAVFGDVPSGSALLFPDCYGRVGLAINEGSFAAKFKISLGAQIGISRRRRL